jgi:hypothetical protein
MQAVRAGGDGCVTNKEGIDEREPAEEKESAYCLRSGITVVMLGGVIFDGLGIRAGKKSDIWR